VFPEQWTAPKSPWADKRVRLAANHAIDRAAINEAETLGFSKITGSIIPQNFEFYWAGADAAVRSRPGEEAPDRGRLSERLRRR
jgi:ABC-type transport system substrate-binding protein